MPCRVSQPSMFLRAPLLYCSILLVCFAVGAWAAETRTDLGAQPSSFPIEEFRLENGMKFLFLPRPDLPSVSAGWVVKAGAADDLPGQSGLSHLLEHMLFKGSRTIGVRDPDREQPVLDRLDELRLEMLEFEARAQEASDRKSSRLERRIDDLETEFRELQNQARTLTYLGQYSFFYSEFGATGLNATTYPDMTTFYVRVPADRLEGWFWMESDRLLQPVFREFYTEIDVVHEERRMRIDSAPTGRLDEQVRQLYWDTHPYAVGPQGIPAEVDLLTRPMALDHFQFHYRPENLTAVLVGGFDPQQARSWAQKYFGRLETRPTPEPIDRLGESQPTIPGQKRFEASCDCAPQVRALYPSVPFGHPDLPPLDVLTGILNGRTGRLFRSMVLEQEIAFSAFVIQESKKRAGRFSFHGETKGESVPLDLLESWDREVTRLRSEPPGETEIERAVNRMAGEDFRALKDPLALMSQLLYYEGLGDWRRVRDWTSSLQAVMPGDVLRVAKTYLDPEKRMVVVYRKRSTDRSAGRKQPSSEATADR